MSRKKFEDTKKLIHFADNNNLPAGDKLAKIRPLQDRVNASSLECLQKIQSLMNKWYHTLLGTLNWHLRKDFRYLAHTNVQRKLECSKRILNICFLCTFSTLRHDLLIIEMLDFY